MSEFAPAATLRARRPLLLAIEAVGWLHMAGKARAEFLREQAGQQSGVRRPALAREGDPALPVA